MGGPPIRDLPAARGPGASERGIRRRRAAPTVRPAAVHSGKTTGGTGPFGRTVAGITAWFDTERRMLNTALSQVRSRRMP
ncbi:hypothetical protein L3i22_100620 [Actinoplanes sp. L3-i22]|nr:hypothetical protein L3i22_100620 [Actinoplanes sp. L3-i22]